MKNVILAVAAIAVTTPAFGEPSVERGAYLASIMDCSGCHSAMTPTGPDPEEYLTGGSFGFHLPELGIFYPPNLTPSAQGLGDWTDEQVIAAIREGVRPDGRMLAPIMPWPSYSALTDEDAADLVAFLRSLPPSPREIPGPATSETATAPYFDAVFPGQ